MQFFFLTFCCRFTEKILELYCGVLGDWSLAEGAVPVVSQVLASDCHNEGLP